MPTTRTHRKNSVARRPRRNRIGISIQFAVPRRGVPSAAALRRWAALGSREILIRVVGEREGRRLNRLFGKKDRATNVLSFPYAKGGGDIVLCHPVIAREARAQGKRLRAHYAHLVVHGMLHLRGYEHQDAAQAARMERAEIRILARFGFADPYALE